MSQTVEFPSNGDTASGYLAIMAIFGILMLLPGACALLFGGMSVIEGGRMGSDVAPLVFVGLVVGLGGVALIWAAIKGRRG